MKMKRNIILSLVLLFTLVNIGLVSAQETGGYCEVDNGDSCQYIPFGEITLNGNPLTEAQERAFCGFIGGTYHEEFSTVPNECTDVFANMLPEFSTIAAGLALGGAGISFFYLRRNERK